MFSFSTGEIISIVSIISGIIGGFLGSILSIYLNRKQEIKYFYSRIDALLYKWIEIGDIKQVRGDLNNPEIHYILDKLWMWIPEKKNDIEVRKLIYMFIKNGDKLEEYKDSNEQMMCDFKQLEKWLRKNATKVFG